jgi:hypothetical protein
MSAIDHMTRDELLRVQDAARIYQERADNALMPWDVRAPAPVLGEDIATYRRNLAIKLKRLLPPTHKLHKVQYRRMDDAVLTNFEPMLYQAVHDIAYDPKSVPEGRMRKVIEVDQGGTKITKWIGQEHFVREFTRPGRRVTSFMHRYDAAGRPLR